jgi:hypothetical protein
VLLTNVQIGRRFVTEPSNSGDPEATVRKTLVQLAADTERKKRRPLERLLKPGKLLP